MIDFMNKDSLLQSAVLAELGWEPSIDAAHIGVAANAGVITLTGQVESHAEKYMAEQAARRVRGVLAISQEMYVQIPFERQRGDDEICAAIVDRLAWDVAIPKDAVGVKVEGGWVTLTGKVGWQFQKRAVTQNIQRLHGVVGISNQMVIQPGGNTGNISNDINCALNRGCFSNPEAILVTEGGGKVRLMGSVNSWHSHQAAAETAWSAPGTIDVENLLAVV